VVLTGLRGALGFLTTLPVGRSEAAWEAFAARPAVMVPVGYVLGGLLALPLYLGLPATLVGFLFVLGIAVFAGINNLDGLLDVADGVATHGDRTATRSAMKDSDVGVAAVVALGLTLLGLFAAGTVLADMGATGVAVVIAAEVGAKLAMTLVVARGSATHEGLGWALSRNADRQSIPLGVGLAAPAGLLAVWHPAAIGALGTGLLVGLAAERWARERLGGISGDLLGATNEVTRLAGLLVGVIAWTLW
jgi:adenosylcobinamide-GDP ribazoletransferase